MVCRRSGRTTSSGSSSHGLTFFCLGQELPHMFTKCYTGSSSPGWWSEDSAWSSTEDLSLSWSLCSAFKSRWFPLFEFSLSPRVWFQTSLSIVFFSLVLLRDHQHWLCRLQNGQSSMVSIPVLVTWYLSLSLLRNVTKKSASRYFLVTSNYFFYGETLVEQFGVVINSGDPLLL